MAEAVDLNGLIPKVDTAFDALERRDLDGFMSHVADVIHPKCEFRSGIGSVVGGGVYRGEDGIRTWFADLLATAESVHWRDRSYETHGERNLVFLATLELVGSASGVSIDGDTAAVFRFRDDGLCHDIDSFLDHDEGRTFAEAHAQA